MTDISLSELIALSRKRAGLEQLVVAEKMDVGQQTISRWERGKTAPTISQVTKLASVLEAPEILELRDASPLAHCPTCRCSTTAKTAYELTTPMSDNRPKVKRRRKPNV